MRHATFVPVEQYLNTSYDPDREYVNGEVIERNVGERDHSWVQGELLAALRQLRSRGILALPEQRLEVAPRRYRVPDICVYLGRLPRQQVFAEPPFLAVEIQSRADKTWELEEKIRDYLAFGVPYVWVIDPARRTASVYTPSGATPFPDGVLRTENPAIAVLLEDVLYPEE